jgi:hypothetical protein
MKSSYKQEIFRCVNGKWNRVNRGDDILVPCKEQDVKTGKIYYITTPMNPAKFYEQFLSHLVEWDTIQTLIKYNRLWQLKEEAPE